MQIRRAAASDIAAITGIYNEAVLTTTATFDTEPQTADERHRWFLAHVARHPILVAVVDGAIVGGAAISPWSKRRAYADTAETSFYVASAWQGQGIGRRLKQATIDQAEQSPPLHQSVLCSTFKHSPIAASILTARRVEKMCGRSGSVGNLDR